MEKPAPVLTLQTLTNKPHFIPKQQTMFDGAENVFVHTDNFFCFFIKIKVAFDIHSLNNHTYNGEFTRPVHMAAPFRDVDADE